VAQQSSALVMFRALVMLLCLLAIPAAALFAPSMPEIVKAIREKRWPVLAGPSQGTPPPSRTEEPRRFVPDNTKPLAAASPAALPGPATPPAVTPAGGAQVYTPGQQSPPSDVVPAGYQAAVEPYGKAPAAPMPGGEPPLPSRGADVEPGRAAPSAADPIAATHQRLSQMGATHYILEFWGKEQFRFQCWMAIGGNPSYTRHFEAVKSNPLHAMTSVLEQVESWRAGRL
jgi:hypothetical protein